MPDFEDDKKPQDNEERHPFLDLWGNEKSPPVLILDDLKVPDEGGVMYGPLNMTLGNNETALVQVDNPSLIANILRAVLALRKPPQGDVYFLMRKMDIRQDLLTRSRIYRQMGLVVELVSLLSDLSAAANLMTFLLYHRPEDHSILQRRAEGILAGLGFTKALMCAPTHQLNKAFKTLGLVALGIAKEPPIIILERPKHFLGRMFSRAWNLLIEEAKAKGTGVLVLALATENYKDLDFDTRVVLKL
ncbi:MAG: hypothetical protein LBE27_08090 [Deltaproteobacteria bacterium]|jgi:ABC-type transporter Mla maintaining outer membrane lipid asymmetry ATPase subunit MlaF|nr:hypothetical protein [Deltaproteobacteria bacterium]